MLILSGQIVTDYLKLYAIILLNTSKKTINDGQH